MSEPLPGEIFESASRLVEGIEEFTSKEKGIERAGRIRESNRRLDLEEKAKSLRREADASIERLREEAEEEIRMIESVAAKREERIAKAQIRVRSGEIEDRQRADGQRKARLQREFIEAEKKRDRRTDEARQDYESEKARLEDLRNRLLATEKAAGRVLRGFPGKLRRYRNELARGEEAEDSSPENVLDPAGSATLEKAIGEVEEEIELYRTSAVKWFNRCPFVIQVFLLLAAGGAVPFVVPGWREAISGGNLLPLAIALGVAGVLLLLLFGFHLRVGRSAGDFVERVGKPAATIRRGRRRVREVLSGELEARRDEAIRAAEQEWKESRELFESGLMRGGGEGVEAASLLAEERANRLRERLASLSTRRIESIRSRRDSAIEAVEAECRVSTEQLETDGEGAGAGEESAESRKARLLAGWRETVVPEHEKLAKWSSEPGPSGWADGDPTEWEPPETSSDQLRIGRFRFDAGGDGLDASDLSLDGDPAYDIPFSLSIPRAASILLESSGGGRSEAIERLQSLVLGWLAGSPPGRLAFTLIDPVGLGESFAGLMHLADYDDQLLPPRVRTRSEQIEECLGELCGHMEKVIQIYLRSDYETITDYNRAAGSVAERYHFVVVADFPNGFSDLALTRLRSIAVSGARCGIYLLVHRDGKAGTAGEAEKELESALLRLCWRDDAFGLAPGRLGALELDPVPDTETIGRWVHRLGEANRDSRRVEVPFSLISPGEGESWTRSTDSDVRVAIGKRGATKLQELVLGVGTCQHALVAGKTGSGKSTLFHVMVTNLAQWYSPDEVEFYLIDFKKGVEFKCYAEHELPHARVVAIESDRDFGVSVLAEIDDEMRRRGELFREAGVQDLEGYRRKGGGETLPRTLLLIDEFQEFFVEDDSISQEAAVRLDRIVRQGRAFGVHAVLGSQTLGGAFTLARATLGQMVVRIALACNEADSYLIMDDSNPAPRLLTRPGEGIYNDQAGAEEANSPFQVVWLGEAERDERLSEIRSLAEKSGLTGRPRFVFEGDRPGEVEHVPEIAALSAGSGASDVPIVYLGEPNAIRSATSVPFPRQGGAHLLIVGPRPDLADIFTAVAVRLLAGQVGSEGRVLLVDPRVDDEEGSSWFRDAVHAVPGVEKVGPAGIEAAFSELGGLLRERGDDPAAGKSAPVFLVIPAFQKQKKLRVEEDFGFSLDEEAKAGPGEVIRDLLVEGPEAGIHLIVSIDSRASLMRCLGRNAAESFERRVLFQMSEADSASLVDSAEAARLGLYRALLHDEAKGTSEVFRPFAEPALDWFATG